MSQISRLVVDFHLVDSLVHFQLVLNELNFMLEKLQLTKLTTSASYIGSTGENRNSRRRIDS